MSFIERYGADVVLQTVRNYLTSNPGRARQARSVGLDDVVQETMFNLLRYPPKKDVLLLNGCYWTASYTLRKMLARRRPVRPAGLFYNLPDDIEQDDSEEVWDLVEQWLPVLYGTVVYRHLHGETFTSMGASEGKHLQTMCDRFAKGIRWLRRALPAKQISQFLPGE